MAQLNAGAPPASRRRRVAWTFVALGLAGIIVLGGAWRVGTWAMAPAPATIDAVLTMPFENVVIDSGSGSALSGWFVPADGGASRGAVVLMHGIRANRLAMVGRAGFLHRAGYDVLLFDFQAHGESPGEQITFGHLESRDAAAAVAWMAARRPGPVAAIGTSLGGAAALLGDAPLPVDQLVLEAVYPRIGTAIGNRLAIRLGAPGRLLVAPLLLLQLGPRLGVSPARLAPVEGMRLATARILVIGGDADRHTTAADTRELFDSAPQPRSLWMIAGAAHVDFHAYATVEYERRVLAFLAQ